MDYFTDRMKEKASHGGLGYLLCERIMKRNKKNKRIKRSNPFAKAVRTPLFKSRVEKDRKKEAKKTGKYLDEE